MTGYIIQVPVLFDMSGDTLVYGEDGTRTEERITVIKQ